MATTWWRANARIHKYGGRLFAWRLPCRGCLQRCAAIILLSTVSCDKSAGQEANFREMASAKAQTFKQMVERNRSLLSGTNEIGGTLFDYVAASGRIDVAQIMLDEHANVNVKDVRQGTPLRSALCNNQSEMARFLIDHHADVRAKDNTGRTPLHDAMVRTKSGHVSGEIVELLLDNGADINAKDQFSRTPLFDAITFDQIDGAKLLLARNASTAADPTDGGTLLMHAAAIGRKDMVELLLQHGADIDARAKNGWTALDAAMIPDWTLKNDPQAERDRKEVADLLISRGIVRNIFDAVVTGDLDEVRKLVKANPHVMASKDSWGKTPLHFAAMLPDVDVAEFLLTNGADVAAKDSLGVSPLHCAAEAGSRVVAKELLAWKANVDAKDAAGLTPLCYAVKAGGVLNVNVAALLLTHGADPNARAHDGQTPLSRATAGSDIAKLLIAHSGHT